MKLIIIDDEPVIGNGIAYLVRKLSLKWDVAGVFSYAEEALEICDWDNIQLALVDINMPGIDGLSLISILRERGFTTPVVFITAYAKFEYAQNALKQGALDYLLKPVSRQDLEAVLRKAEEEYQKMLINQSDTEYIEHNLEYLRKNFLRDVIFEERNIQEEELHQKIEWYALKNVTFSLMAVYSHNTKKEIKSKLLKINDAMVKWYLYGEEYFYLILFIHDGNTSDIFEEFKTTLSETDICHITTNIKDIHKLPIVYQRLLLMTRDELDKKNELRKIHEEDVDMPEEMLIDEGTSIPVQRAIQYIKENCCKKLSLKKIAQEVYLHPTYLSNAFKKQTGMTVVDYLNWCRIKRAKELLNEPENKICWVMEQVGFANQRYFSQVFKKITHVTPSQYKQNAFLRGNSVK